MVRLGGERRSRTRVLGRNNPCRRIDAPCFGTNHKADRAENQLALVVNCQVPDRVRREPDHVWAAALLADRFDIRNYGRLARAGNGHRDTRIPK